MIVDSFWGDRSFWSDTQSMWATTCETSLIAGTVKIDVAGHYRRNADITLSTVARISIRSRVNVITEISAECSLNIKGAATGGTSLTFGDSVNSVGYPVIYAETRLNARQGTIDIRSDRRGPTYKTKFWGGSARTMIYKSVIIVPQEAHNSILRVIPKFEYGTLLNIEYGKGIVGKFWVSPFWSNKMWRIPYYPEKWYPMENGIPVLENDCVFVRIFTSDKTAAKVCELEWVFDVDDAMLSLQDVEIPPEGKRLLIPHKYFHWINTVTLGLQFYEGSEAITSAWVDKGLTEDGFIIKGPLIICLDKTGKRVQGNIDVLLQGAKGI